jgi:hypothetical protein
MVFDWFFDAKRAAKVLPRRFCGQAFLSLSGNVTDRNVLSRLAIGTYVNGRRLPLQGRGWGFESLRAYHQPVGQAFLPVVSSTGMRACLNGYE